MMSDYPFRVDFMD